MATDQAQRAVEAFADAVAAKFAAQVPVGPADQLKAPVEALVQAVGNLVVPGRPVTVARESPGAAPIRTGRLDMAIVVAGALNGYIELKAPGKGARPERFTGRDREQWERFRRYPNLIYTDGNEWARFETGERAGPLVRLCDDITTAGSGGIGAGGPTALVELLRPFLRWDPTPPQTSKGVADTLARLCLVLRDHVLDGLAVADSNLAAATADLRRYLTPGGSDVSASDRETADAYAQSVTYGLVIGRFEGADPLTVASARATLRADHSLLAQVLGTLADQRVRDELGTAVDLLERVIGSIDPARITSTHGEDPWLYFYEDFLTAYDPALRKRIGAYYTPRPVVRAQVRLVSELLTGERLAKARTGGGFADPGVVVLDPATGTGTYPLAVLEHAAASVPPDRRGQLGNVVTRVAENLTAFELMVGPYAVAHLRLSQEIADHGGVVPAGGVHVFLADTLDPHDEPRQAAVPGRVVVCLGNPPYSRGRATGRRVPGVPGILEDFLAPARAAGAGGHLKNLYNDYVHFWRWALWKVFEHAPDDGGAPGAGIVTFVTASSYLRGPGFVGMRRHMRMTFDDLWIIDLGGDNKGARRSDNVFAIETPVCIAVGVRYGPPRPDEPATVRYASLAELPRAEKNERLDSVVAFADLDWRECLRGWQDPFLPAGNARYFGWPLLADLVPWQTNGMSFFRSWPIGENREVLEDRWRELLADSSSARRAGASPEDRTLLDRRKRLFKESRDRKVGTAYSSLGDPAERLPPIGDLPPDAPCPDIQRIGFRSLDRQWATLDRRVGDFLRPEMQATVGDEQVFLTSSGFADVLGRGPAAMVTALPPDYHVFCGRGGQHIAPLWRDPAATSANITSGLLEALGSRLGHEITPEALFAYCYCVLAANDYVDRFWEELTIPGVRVPLTTRPALFAAVRDHGRRLVWLHTYGERFVPDGGERGVVPEGAATYAVGIPDTAAGYPTTFSYSCEDRALHVGAGRYDRVDPAVWDYSISGWPVVSSWLGYRMQKRAGRKSSALDEIRPRRWPDPDGRELLRLLWIIEHTVAVQPELTALLVEVVGGPTIEAAVLPSPTARDRRPPVAARGEDGDGQAARHAAEDPA